MDHSAYPDSYIRGILNTVKTIAMVGFSPKENRPSYFAFKYLLERGYRVFPVNPGHAGKEVRGQKVDPSRIHGTALLTIEGELDDISGRGQTRAAQKLCSGIPEADRQHLVVEGAGHYGIFSGRRWRTQVYPKVRDFFAHYAGG